MIPNSYNSFEDIDNQLKIISLQKQIYKQQIKQHLRSSKASFSATSIKSEVKNTLQIKLLEFITTNLIKKFR
ncbi:DUF6327 family protein [Psychroserpens sp. NJDZ02]|uniref:DUF6327 family protein n=1 Tax=Psychroserpens sp. NJDZ02 TaxID=2570561 RepID=UPI0010A7B3A7|nr:DUF6327 family protein [Psychroserpens sp. NJDZ02]QCE40465.1 hypothetical protein E9099_03230 [Psychroserpens sp. NJDZ02]